LDENGDPGIKIELLAERGEIKIPLRYESDGIKLGGQDEKVYEKTDKHRIARAFKTDRIK